MSLRLVLPTCTLILLAACTPQQKEAAAAPVVEAQRALAEVFTGAVVDTQGAIAEALPMTASPPAARPDIPASATPLIVRWEVTSPAVYTRKYQRPIWPGGHSGVTVGIGYDLGMNTASTILGDWEAHPHRGLLASMNGITGTAAKNLAAQRQEIVVPYPMAEDVFTASTLPRYHDMAKRAFGAHFTSLSDGAQGALDSLVYNRGASMTGPNRREMREIRDVCKTDTQCIATQLRAMCRIWEGTPNGTGLCKRRHDEARVAES